MGLMDWLGGGKPNAAVTAEALLQELKTGKGPMVVDVREPAELSGPLGALKGAKNVPLSQLQNRVPEIPKDRPVVLICHSGARSGQALKFLSAQGYTQLRNVAGGMMAVRAVEAKLK